MTKTFFLRSFKLRSSFIVFKSIFHCDCELEKIFKLEWFVINQYIFFKENEIFLKKETFPLKKINHSNALFLTSVRISNAHFRSDTDGLRRFSLGVFFPSFLRTFFFHLKIFTRINILDENQYPRDQKLVLHEVRVFFQRGFSRYADHVFVWYAPGGKAHSPGYEKVLATVVSFYLFFLFPLFFFIWLSRWGFWRDFFSIGERKKKYYSCW